MDRFWKCLAILFVIGAALWFGPIIYNDVTSPELWSDWRHDPRWYGPLLLLSVAITVAIFVVALREESRTNRKSGPNSVTNSDGSNRGSGRTEGRGG
jgi:hypothetical protein